MNDTDNFSATMHELAQSLHGLNQKATLEYGQVVEEIIRSRSQDVRHIEHTLDGLLDFCGYDPALQHYRKLCRYYYDIDPMATVGYVNAYRELWDSDADKETEA